MGEHSVRTCKVCKVEKEYIYLGIDGRQRSAYRDEQGSLWHGRTCYACFKEHVARRANKRPLGMFTCATCNAVLKKHTWIQKTCSKTCYAALVERRLNKNG